MVNGSDDEALMLRATAVDDAAVIAGMMKMAVIRMATDGSVAWEGLVDCHASGRKYKVSVEKVNDDDGEENT